MDERHEMDAGSTWAFLLLAIAFSNLSEDTQRVWAKAAEESNKCEERRETFRKYSEDCPSLDRHMDGNAYERLCMDHRHPFHGDSRPQCAEGVCPHLHPNGHPFTGCFCV